MRLSSLRFLAERAVTGRGLTGTSVVGLYRANLSSISSHRNPNSSAPLIESYRSAWPDAFEAPAKEDFNLPPRTVPDECLRFEYTATFHSGSTFFYSHLPSNPADFKVVLKVNIEDLKLDQDERCIFMRMVGPRYNVGRKELRLTERRFPNRLENKKYLVLLLEKLLAECRRLNSIKHEYESSS